MDRQQLPRRPAGRPASAAETGRARADPGTARLLHDGDPAVRRLARLDLLVETVPPEVDEESRCVRALVGDGGIGLGAAADPYRKWTGAHWRLVSLVELGVGAANGRAVAAASALLAHWSVPRRLARVPVVSGRARRCASQEGNAVAVACRLGLAGDDRVQTLVERLLAWQWDCTNTPTPAVTPGAERAAELLLAHKVVFSRRTGRLLTPSVAELHYPPYWHYDVLQALLILTRAGHAADRRMRPARDLVADRRGVDGRWRAGRRWWRPPGTAGSGVEALDWGGVADQMITLNALRVVEHDHARCPVDRPIAKGESHARDHPQSLVRHAGPGGRPVLRLGVPELGDPTGLPLR